MEAIERTFFSNDLITITFLIALVLVFFMKVYQSNHLTGYVTAFFTPGFIEKRAEDNISIFSKFYSLLFVFSIVIISATLFTTITAIYFQKTFTCLVYTFAGTLIYYILKYTLNFLLARLFDLKEDIRYLLYTKNGYLYTSCLLLFPVLIINQYFIKTPYFLIVSIALLLIIRAFLIFSNNKNAIFSHMFYFILYFCALEISPLLILYKTIN